MRWLYRHEVDTESVMKRSEIIKDWRKLPRYRPDKDEKHLAYSVLIANGISREKAATMLGYSAKTARSIDRALKEKHLKLQLLSKQRIKKAHRVVDKLLSGKTFGDIESVKDSTALRAAEIVIDRHEPKGQEQASPAITSTTYNLNLVRPDHPDCIPLPPSVDNPPHDGDMAPITPDKKDGQDEKE
jgi:hypothetical protein